MGENLPMDDPDLSFVDILCIVFLIWVRHNLFYVLALFCKVGKNRSTRNMWNLGANMDVLIAGLDVYHIFSEKAISLILQYGILEKVVTYTACQIYCHC